MLGLDDPEGLLQPRCFYDPKTSPSIVLSLNQRVLLSFFRAVPYPSQSEQFCWMSKLSPHVSFHFTVCCEYLENRSPSKVGLCGISLHCELQPNYSSPQFLSFKQLFIQTIVIKFPLRHVWNKDFVGSLFKTQANYINPLFAFLWILHKAQAGFWHTATLCQIVFFYLYIC